LKSIRIFYSKKLQQIPEREDSVAQDHFSRSPLKGAVDGQKVHIASIDTTGRVQGEISRLRSASESFAMEAV
jgi:hypothetical protein